MGRRDYSYEVLADRLRIAGYEPTPMGLEKLIRDLYNARRLDRELQGKDLHSGEIDRLLEIKKALPTEGSTLADMKDILDMMRLLHSSGIACAELKDIIEARNFFKEKGQPLTAENLKRLGQKLKIFKELKEDYDVLRERAFYVAESLKYVGARAGELEEENEELEEKNERLEAELRRKGRSSDDSSLCYVATVTLVGSDSEFHLDTLRSWRDHCLRTSTAGRKLEEYYHGVGPVISPILRRNKLLAFSCLHVFVKPSVWLAGRRPALKAVSHCRDLLLYVLFICGLIYGAVVVKLVSAKD